MTHKELIAYLEAQFTDGPEGLLERLRVWPSEQVDDDLVEAWAKYLGGRRTEEGGKVEHPGGDLQVESNMEGAHDWIFGHVWAQVKRWMYRDDQDLRYVPVVVGPPPELDERSKALAAIGGGMYVSPGLENDMSRRMAGYVRSLPEMKRRIREMYDEGDYRGIVAMVVKYGL